MSLHIDQNLNSPIETLLSSRNSPNNKLLLKRFQSKGLTMLSKTVLLLLCLSSTFTFAAAKAGAGSGGGGDATEERVNEIRSDILDWIKNDGAKGLKLPSEVSYGEYTSQMTLILQPKKVVIGFVEKDDLNNDELKVSVNGVPKTCRGFISTVDSKYHILCNISRFKNNSESEQYRLIHHEYAGLVNLENNEGAASDYFISSQLTDFLRATTVLKLSVKPLSVKKSYYDKVDEYFSKGSVPQIDKIADMPWPGRCFTADKPNEPINAFLIIGSKKAPDIGPIESDKKMYIGTTITNDNKASNYFDNLSLEEIIRSSDAIHYNYKNMTVSEDAIEVSNYSKIRKFENYLVEAIGTNPNGKGFRLCYFFKPECKNK